MTHESQCDQSNRHRVQSKQYRNRECDELRQTNVRHHTTRYTINHYPLFVR
ncbi:Uncharacterised protein [Vibrio cholerae]|nr:Uncharacterised protein [Vibrio cholerae]CSD16294.1 Uncharacterised protein [Vibrio cholerae]CSI48801.1 Uncharacterised protein [Vibrio cholerae]